MSENLTVSEGTSQSATPEASQGVSTGTSAVSEREPLLTPEFLGQLERLRLMSKKVFLGRLKGERRSRKRGVSIEFADYRDYSKGDDLRFLDWNIYGRLDRLFTKLFHEEEDLSIYLLVDSSASMDTGQPSKYTFGRRMAAALAYIGLVGLDRVGLAAAGGDNFYWHRPQRGRGQLHKVIRFLETVPGGGTTHLQAAARQLVIRQSRGGVVVLISDLFDTEGFSEALKALLQGGNDVYILHVLSPQERHPEFAGALRLLDVETDEPVEISVTPELIKSYRNRLLAFCSEIEKTCTKRGAHYLQAVSDADPSLIVCESLKRMGLVT